MGVVTNLPNRRAEQQELFEIEPEDDVLTSSGKEEVAFNDPAFARNKILPIHRWVPWIAGFSSDFVRDALNKYLNRPSTVLDPFAGVGTSLVDAVLFGHEAIGFESIPMPLWLVAQNSTLIKFPRKTCIARSRISGSSTIEASLRTILPGVHRLKGSKRELNFTVRECCARS